MKKILSTLFVIGATALTASADVTTFVPQGAPLCRYNNPGNAAMVEMPAGFCWRIQSDTKQRGPQFVEKTVQSDLVQLNEEWVKEDPDNYNSNAISLVPCSHIECGSLRWYWGRVINVVPAEGVTVTSVKMKLNRPADYFPVSIVERNGTSLSRIEDFVYTEADSTMTWTGSRDKAFYMENMGKDYALATGTMRIIYIEVTTTGTPNQVAVPQCNIRHSMIAANEKVELTCATPGAQIYYTVDYERTWGAQTKNIPTTGSTLYTGPFSIEKDAIVRAFAVKDGMAPSFKTYKELYLMPEYTFMAEFNFNDYTSLKDEDGKQIVDYKTYPVINSAMLAEGATVEKVSLAKTPAVDKDVTFTGTITNETDGIGCDLTLSNTFGGVVQLRPLNKSQMIISVPDDKYISAVYMEASVSNNIQLGDGIAGTYKTGEINGCQKIWTSGGSKDVYEVIFDVKASSQYVDHLYVFYSNYDGSGVNVIEASEADAPVEYFNLQGIRVANPSKGRIYIKRQGSKTTKIVY